MTRARRLHHHGLRNTAYLFPFTSNLVREVEFATQMEDNRLPPLLGNKNGRYRVSIVGNSGTGKSTTGAALAIILRVPYIAMDTLYYEPGWKANSKEVFQAKLRAALDQDERGWVADGNYNGMGGTMALEEATDVIWLDPPLYVYFPRILLRTFLRLFRVAPPCSPGCFERPSETFFSRNSILFWCLSNHWEARRTNQERMKVIGIEAGSDVANRKMRRFGGWGSDVKEWLKDVANMLRSKMD